MVNYANLLVMSEQDFEEAKAILDNGINIDPNGMDFLDIYAILTLLGATGNERNFYLASPIKEEQVRNLRNELPCEYTFANSIKFTLL